MGLPPRRVGLGREPPAQEQGGGVRGNAPHHVSFPIPRRSTARLEADFVDDQGSCVRGARLWHGGGVHNIGEHDGRRVAIAALAAAAVE